MIDIPITDWVRRYALAIACVVGPFVLLNFGMDGAVGSLVPHQQVAQLPPAFTYKLRDAEAPTPAPAVASASAGTGDAGVSEKNAAPEAARMQAYARHIAGRYNFAIGSGFVYLASAIALGFGAMVVYQRTGILGVAIAAAASCALAAYVTRNVGEFPYARPLIIDGILGEADRHQHLKALAIAGRSTAEIVNGLMKAGTFIGVTAVGLLIAVFCLASVRVPTADLTLDELKRRQSEIRVALVLASAILVLYVLVSKMLLHWPLSLLADEQRPALEPIADALLFHWSAGATIVLLMIFIPAIAAWWLDVEAFRNRGGEAQAAADGRIEGLQFAPISTVTSVIVALAPILASPITDALRSVISALPAK